ncbi:MAG TPA: methionyl-tRNA formyltransferase [Ktedonobacteraceae bacterium]
MSNTTASEHPRVLFFGMLGNFSYAPLLALLKQELEICAVVMPAQHSGFDQPAIQLLEHKGRSRSLLPMLNSTSILQLATQRQIPVWEVSNLLHPEAITLCTSYQPDIICVACFSLRIPRAILTIPRFGCLNVHPSLLPANRGPEPLFWTFREGDQQTGVTIHMMDEGMDTGDIMAQGRIEVPDGISCMQLEERCAAIGGRLLAGCVWELYKGLAVPVKQDEKQSSYHPFPSGDDFVVNVAEWDARHVYNFICGIVGWGEPITLVSGDTSMRTGAATSYSHKNSVYFHEGEELWIPCRVGSVRIKPWE